MVEHARAVIIGGGVGGTSIAYHLTELGWADVVLTGGSDVLARLTYGGFNSLRSVDPGPCRPFDRERKGLSIGEAAGILVFGGCGSENTTGTLVKGNSLDGNDVGVWLFNGDATCSNPPARPRRSSSRGRECAPR